MFEHSLEGFPLLGITMCMLHACCYLSVFLACVYLWRGRGGFILVHVFMQPAHICMRGATVCVCA